MNLTTLDYQNPQYSRRRAWRRRLLLLGGLLIIGVASAVLAPSVRHVNHAVYVSVPVVVTDEKTGQPVRNASVTFDSDYEGLRRTTTTDASGTAKVVVEFIETGLRFDPLYTSVRYSTEGTGLLVEAGGYATIKVPIIDQKEFMIFGLGTEPKWQISALLQPLGTTQPSRE